MAVQRHSRDLLLLVAFWASPSFAETLSSSVLQPKGRDCLLTCENHGYCEFVSSNVEELKVIAQSGGLIQRCRCPPGWGGVTCEIPTEDCNLETKTCEISGRPCDQVGNEWMCHCGIADTVDANFAAKVCRHGYTEYCNPHAYNPDGPLYFCTNGGKCAADFLSVKEGRPTDVAVREKFMAAGCLCNEHFEGERCERLRFEAKDLIGRVNPNRFPFPQDKDQRSSSSSDKEHGQNRTLHGLVFAVVFAAAGVFLAVVALVYYHHVRRQYRKELLERALCGQDDCFSDTDDDYSLDNTTDSYDGGDPRAQRRSIGTARRGPQFAWKSFRRHSSLVASGELQAIEEEPTVHDVDDDDDSDYDDEEDNDTNGDDNSQDDQESVPLHTGLGRQPRRN